MRKTDRKNRQHPISKAPQKTALKTLDRVLSKAGLASRTDARRWIAAGRVAVNGKVVQTPDVWVDPERDRVSIDGKPLTAEERVYLLLYKPKGYITSYKDPEGRPTVYDLIPAVVQWVSPVGRLDLDTSGLLILTNDNAFADYITSPESKVAKTYRVKTSSLLPDEALDLLRRGVELSDGPTEPAVVRRIDPAESRNALELTITEGRNRQVRRMIEAVGSSVRKLVRTAIGPVRIDRLEIGSFRELNAREVELLRRSGAESAQPGARVRGSPRKDVRRKLD